MKCKYLSLAMCIAALSACSDSNPDPESPLEPTELADEWYSGGKLGTVFNETSYAYEQPTPAIENAGLTQAFKHGEQQFERDFNENSSGAFSGLGPLMVRRGCLYCHPNYGHGKRQTEYRANTMGNGYPVSYTHLTLPTILLV